MIDTIMMLGVAFGAILVAYRAMTLHNADEINGEPEAPAADEPKNAKWRKRRQTRASRPKL